MTARFVCLGDSTTEGIGDSKGYGWVGRLQHYLSEAHPNAWRVLNLGVAGDTCIDIKHRLLSEVAYRTPSRMILCAGGNDMSVRVWPDSIGSKVDINYARDIWRQIIAEIKKNNIRTLVLGLTPVNESALPLVFRPYDENDHGHMSYNSKRFAYETMLAEEMKSAGLPFIPMFKRLSETDYLKHLDDGVHPTAEGYDQLFNVIKTEGEAIGFFTHSR